MQYVIKNQSSVALLVDFTDGSERILQPGQYVLYNGPAEITRGSKRELVDVGLVDVYEVDATEYICEKREPFSWQEEGF